MIIAGPPESNYIEVGKGVFINSSVMRPSLMFARRGWIEVDGELDGKGGVDEFVAATDG